VKLPEKPDGLKRKRSVFNPKLEVHVHLGVGGDWRADNCS